MGSRRTARRTIAAVSPAEEQLRGSASDGGGDEASILMTNLSRKDSSMAPSLPPALSAQLFLNAALRRLLAGEALFVAGDPGDGCYRLEQGLLKVVITSPQG